LFNAQAKEPNVYMVIADDLGPGTHPRDKDRYGRRIARVALGAVYETGDEYFGPKYESMTTKGSRIRLRFSHVGKGLTARGTEYPQGFMVAGRDEVFHWAEARIDGKEIELWSKAVAKPVAVRYAWAWTFPWANLFNKDGFPAVTFRTDDWASPGPYLERR
jgi:sialate O-acetylesterase